MKMEKFRHIVLLKLVPSTTEEQLTAIMDGLNELPEKIPEIRSYEIGVDCGLAEGNSTVAVVGDFDCVEDYQTYASHPAHIAVIKERIKPFLEQGGRSAVQSVPRQVHGLAAAKQQFADKSMQYMLFTCAIGFIAGALVSSRRR